MPVPLLETPAPTTSANPPGTGAVCAGTIWNTWVVTE